jgi:hypothetical protein
MLSLYDYLGYAAGVELGLQVAEYSRIRIAKHGSKHVSNPKYTGNVSLYEKDFLDEFFKVKSLFVKPVEELTEINTQLMKDSFKAEIEEEISRIF